MPRINNIPESDKVRERFFRSYEELRYRGIVKTKKDFCENIGISYVSNFNRMQQPNMEPTISNILTLCKKYNVSMDWIMFGRGDFLNK
jgi:hypothetical protein